MSNKINPGLSALPSALSTISPSQSLRSWPDHSKYSICSLRLPHLDIVEQITPCGLLLWAPDPHTTLAVNLCIAPMYFLAFGCALPPPLPYVKCSGVVWLYGFCFCPVWVVAYTVLIHHLFGGCIIYQETCVWCTLYLCPHLPYSMSIL